MTDTPTSRTRSRGWPSALAGFVTHRVEKLQWSYLSPHGGHGRSTTVASLARLRRAVASAPGADPFVWAETLEGLPIEYQGSDGEATPAEHAAHAAITLYAVHQQSKAIGMHQRDVSLGRAVARLAHRNPATDAHDSDKQSPVLRRFLALGTATSFHETLHHARGLITQLRGASIPLDYGLLAYHLARLQRPSYADGVRLDWGRDYYFFTSDDTTDKAPSSASSLTNDTITQ
ncbi:type I-E CRISPR-associated protein Cse2/CasB [Rathayibacter toxicus]|uniref:Type I-E CRISPR-associated protein Cse2/CasB n=1 Tax=Rathayibacter toxicus TaxID=145458 RepID=A0A2S5Y9V0_9MICO|nr:type I-E CRISPR-associated protein Cse2/CasB [Rathayibacter toxicus]PPH25478.1 type I-E CRISPR-associated protein Cse2/CasB [Rathayibacter toxicus]PPH59181.1 type I-E CRISPR-associated protein Cse2/CasB [Rathayibacter toxicus]PPH61290.1 type I-E CRISPR-associated protein Cse2/CasB [Rathayibacter toxicus]PPH89257.1 type I-E CRISPR-associated protein Cse2/CasB [Rathayibacter toxicus]PPI17083.1 type I-E CRISPR-associated protein Cse2/CasB [Rathayibacter toxicus]